LREIAFLEPQNTFSEELNAADTPYEIMRVLALLVLVSSTSGTGAPKSSLLMRHAALPRPRAPAPCAEQRGIRLEGSARELKTYTEQSREYRRTVYGHDSWVKHRDSTRFLRNLQTTLESGVARSLYTEIAVVTLVSTFVVFVNCLITGYDDLAGEHYKAVFQIPLIKSLTLPALPFNFAMGALSLLLVFRTNTAYSRWNEARTLWGGIVNTCRNLGRQANAYFPQDATGQKLRAQLASQVAMFPKALRSFLRGADDDDKTLLQAIALIATDSNRDPPLGGCPDCHLLPLIALGTLLQAIELLGTDSAKAFMQVRDWRSLVMIACDCNRAARH